MRLGEPLKFQETATFKTVFNVRGMGGEVVPVSGEFEIHLNAPFRLIDQLTTDEREDLLKVLATRVKSMRLSIDLENEKGEPMTAERLEDVVALLRHNDALFQDYAAWALDRANFLKG